ncbi:aspartate aminotransferase family protein [Conchiformibius kuhniae]|uniref:Acetylornithine aminotransferase n=1 Tax=Conchiformibius kuhniae TaxID=211502 RepID=A0A8T9MXD8_9NEIS|nr:aspartate aminotransferase family protein [Conchiformibius kuhniae]UOP05535.1 aspartate aminotransferase family protein [Conchiformibius kuhniae]
MDIQTLEHAHTAQTYARFPTALVRGEGVYAWDEQGKPYLDFTSGIGVNSLGWCDAQWCAAVSAQAAQLQHTSNLYYTRPAAELAQTLAEKSGLSAVFFGNSGAEANECAIKTARKYSRDRYGAHRHTILTLDQSFHGRTVTTLSATAQAQYHQHFFPFTEGFDSVPANDIAALQARLAQGGVCALMLEIVQGEGGLNLLDGAYLAEAQRLCREHDVLLLIDEVQTGIGRTGQMFAFQHFDLSPDIITLAKGLGGGLPIGAAVFGARCRDTLGRGDHGSTFGGNPVCCAGANAVLARLDAAFLAEVRRKGEALQAALRGLPNVRAVSGLGLMVGAELADGIAAGEVAEAARQRGLLLLTAKHKLRFLPPLIISEQEINEGVAILREVLADLHRA